MTEPVNGAWSAVKALIRQTLGTVEIFDSSPLEVRSMRGDARGFPKIDATLRSAEEFTPVGTDIPDGPCDAIMVTEADATVTGLTADDTAAAYTTAPLAAGVWHPISFSRITATSAAGGTVHIAWYRRHGT